MTAWVRYIAANGARLLATVISGLVAAIAGIPTFLAFAVSAYGPTTPENAPNILWFIVTMGAGSACGYFAQGLSKPVRCPTCDRLVADRAALDRHCEEDHGHSFLEAHRLRELRRQVEWARESEARRVEARARRPRCPECGKQVETDRGVAQHRAAKHAA